ncbi:MAG: hypothetical protein ABI253_06660 [Mycobacterium sp.]
MKITLLVAAAAAVAGTASFGLSEHADNAPGFTGRYAYLAAGSPGTPFTTTWTVTPCGQDCVHITTASGLTDTDAHRAGSGWVFEKYDEAGIRCDNQKVLPATIQFTIDPASLRGQLQPLGTPCGGASRASEFTLSKIT